MYKIQFSWQNGERYKVKTLIRYFLLFLWFFNFLWHRKITFFSIFRTQKYVTCRIFGTFGAEKPVTYDFGLSPLVAPSPVASLTIEWSPAPHKLQDGRFFWALSQSKVREGGGGTPTFGGRRPPKVGFSRAEGARFTKNRHFFEKLLENR